LKSSSVEAQKALARGIKEELAAQFPEIVDLNAKESKLLGLDDALEDAVYRTRNHNIISLGGKVLVSKNIGLAAMHEVLGIPAVQSRIAIGISRASKIPFPEALARVGAYVSAIVQAKEQQRDQDKSAAVPVAKNEDMGKAFDDWPRFRASDGQLYHVHPEDLDELKRRDPGVKILGQIPA